MKQMAEATSIVKSKPIPMVPGIDASGGNGRYS